MKSPFFHLVHFSYGKKTKKLKIGSKICLILEIKKKLIKIVRNILQCLYTNRNIQ